jgi:outer membrane receptor protein involved in Fe transport
VGPLLAACCVIAGNVHAFSGAPLAGAQLELHAAASEAVHSDARGDFSLHVQPGSYPLAVSAPGFAPVTIVVTVNRDVNVQIALEALDSPKLREIGEATVDGRLAPIRGVLPSIDLTRSDFDRLGYDRVVDGLQGLPGATFTRPDGGTGSAIAVVSLRGPDPSESLIALDGQLLNDGNTGDLDLSRLPVAALSGVNVTEGLGAEDSNGSNTFGGAINLISLRPTKDPRAVFSLSGGSFGQSEAWLNATGSQGHLGYATAFGDQNEAGYVNQTVSLYNAACTTPCATALGSSVAAHFGLGALTWSFSQDADVTARVFLLGDTRDQSSSVNGIDGNATDVGLPQFGHFIGPGDQRFAQVVRAYQIRGRMPLGSGEMSADLSESDNGVDVDNSSSPYDLIHQDHRYNAGLTWQRTFATSQFAVGGYTRYESLGFEAPPSGGPALTASQAQPLLGQTIDVAFVRGGFEPSAKLRLDGGLFESEYSSFGANLDGRFGAIYAADPKTALRFSVGTGFRAPLLIERYAFQYAQLPLDANGVYLGQGNANERPEHATEYELGISRELSGQSTLDLSLYQTNLRNPIEVFYPLALAASGACSSNTPTSTTPVPGCVSFSSNDGNAVYQGAEVRFAQRLEAQHLFLSAMYGLNVAYPKNLSADFSNPTSGGNLVAGAQFLGIPQQQGSLACDWAHAGWHATGQAIFRGNNNELHLAPFTLVNGLVGKQLGSHLDLSLAATNLLNAAAGRYTVFGAGVPYRGLTLDPSGATAYGALPTNALHLEPLGFRVVLTARE